MHTPFRTCIGCRASAPQSDLIRIAKIDGEPARLVFDPAKTHPGRGAWLHRTETCLALALKKKAFSRAFRARVTPDELVITA